MAKPGIHADLAVPDARNTSPTPRFVVLRCIARPAPDRLSTPFTHQRQQQDTTTERITIQMKLCLIRR